MQRSKIIQIDGIFLASAVALPDAQGWQLVATDARVGCVDGYVAASFEDAQIMARRAYFSARGTNPASLPPLRDHAAELLC